MSEIKPLNCPFCGGDCIYETFEIDSLGAEIPVIFCNHCKTIFKVENNSPYLNEDKTYDYLAKKNIETWNTRKPMERILERLEEASFWTEQTFDEDGYGNDDSWEAVWLDKAIEIVKEEGLK